MTRHEANLKILEKIVEQVYLAPDQRFGQILRNLGVVISFMDERSGEAKWCNHFNEESVDMLARINREEKGE